MTAADGRGDASAAKPSADGRPAAEIAGASGEFRRGWKPLVASAIGVGLGLSPLPTFTAGVFAVQLQHRFGWPRGAILGGQALVTAALLLLGPPIGRAADKVGARRVLLLSTLAIGLTTAGFALITRQIWTFYLATGLMAFSSVGTLPIVYGKVISVWFDRRRGLALGLTLCTTGLSGIFLPSYVQLLISHFGWRWGYVGLGLLPLTIALPALYFLMPGRDEPGGAPGRDGEAVRLEGVEIAHALRNHRFWLMAFAALAVGVSLGGLAFNMVPLMVDRGLKPAAAAKLFGLYGLAVVCGRIASGWLLDRFWAPLVGSVFLLAPAAAAFWLATGIHQAPVLAVVTLMLGSAGGAEFDLVAYLTSRYFGRSNFGALYAGQYVMFGVGAGAAPGLFGGVHDALGSYDPIIVVAGVLFALAAAAILALGPYPRLAPADG